MSEVVPEPAVQVPQANGAANGPPPITTAELRQKKRAAKDRLWSAGNLSWKFAGRPWAARFYEFVRANWGASPYVCILAHRRSGKSTAGLIIAVEECIRHANVSVAVICKSKDQARAITEESFLEVFNDCPHDLRPRRIKNDFQYVFPNQSKIVILAADGLHAAKARGRKFKFIVVTEAGFIPRIRKIVTSTLSPTLRDVTGKVFGTMLLESTPPDEDVEPADAEDFHAMWAEAELDGRAYSLPLSRNVDANPDFVTACKKDCGGENTVAYRREYECEFVRDESLTAIPEFTTQRAFEGDPTRNLPPIVREVLRPFDAHLYASMDLGGRDLTGLLWGFYHFEQDLVVIEDELTLLNMTSDDLAFRVKEKERELWGPNPGKLLRVSDNNNVILLYDLQRKHGLTFRASAKDNKDAQINQLRVMVRDGRIAIHPRCRLLIKTLRMAKRHKQANKGFERAEEIGHADLLDALLYLVRNVRRHNMPDAPPPRPHADLPRAATPPVPSGAEALVKALGFGRRR